MALVPTPAARLAALLFAVTSGVLIVTHAFRKGATNPNSRMATMDALIHEGTFVIDNSRFGRRTIDKVQVGGHFISSKPPLLSVVGAGVYRAYTFVTGKTFRNGGIRDALYFLNVFFGLLSHLLLIYFFYRFLTLWLSSSLALGASVAALSLGFLGLGYAVSLNNHTPAAALLLGALYHGYVLRRSPTQPPWRWLLAGALGALAPTFDLGAAFFSAGLGIYLLQADRRRTLLWFGSAAGLVLITHFALTYVSSGSLVPVYLRPELYSYNNSYWLRPRGFDALQEPRWWYALHMLVGHHGFFAMTPVLLFGAVALWQAVRSPTQRPEGWLVAGPLLALFVFYIATTHNYGGSCVGFRWLLVAAPPLFLFVGTWLDRKRSAAAMALFLAAFAVSQWNAFDAMQNPWRIGAWNRLVRSVGLGSFTE